MIALIVAIICAVRIVCVIAFLRGQGWEARQRAALRRRLSFVRSEEP